MTDSKVHIPCPLLDLASLFFGTVKQPLSRTKYTAKVYAMYMPPLVQCTFKVYPGICIFYNCNKVTLYIYKWHSLSSISQLVNKNILLALGIGHKLS